MLTSFIHLLLLHLSVFTFPKTPMKKLLFLIIQTINIGMIMASTQQNYLWAMIVLIILLGGMFVIFLYISSLTPKTHPSMLTKTYKSSKIWMMMISLIFFYNMLYNQYYFISESYMFNLTKMYTSFSSSTILLGMYLFFILLIVAI
uniref:NADH dehydrogenase subunit 6 n=1 Tax=Nymphon gracile TaxID=136195 RepID=A0MG46_NYMGR|nr:NADH dehydrogenase subunit 6 [Nymphon gracile]ABF93278.1 NADH dehydrogenase subunit 6 [Nymphon gracile]